MGADLELRLGRLTEDIPPLLPAELVTELAIGGTTRVERIVSRGHASPPDFWYCQDDDEFVLVVSGEAVLAVEGRPDVHLTAGDWVDLPRGLRHRVAWTPPDRDTIWLAVFRR